MKTSRVNPATMNPMEMNNISSMMGMMSSIQKIGKGKRKYSVKLEKGDKKLLIKFVDEAKKQFAVNSSKDQYNGVYNFLNYVSESCSKDGKGDLKVSYEEHEFLKRMLSDSVKGMEKMQFFWYQFIKKIMTKVLLKQYKQLLVKFN